MRPQDCATQTGDSQSAFGNHFPQSKHPDNNLLNSAPCSRTVSSALTTPAQGLSPAQHKHALSALQHPTPRRCRCCCTRVSAATPLSAATALSFPDQVQGVRSPRSISPAPSPLCPRVQLDNQPQAATETETPDRLLLCAISWALPNTPHSSRSEQGRTPCWSALQLPQPSWCSSWLLCRPLCDWYSAGPRCDRDRGKLPCVNDLRQGGARQAHTHNRFAGQQYTPANTTVSLGSRQGPDAAATCATNASV